MQATTSIAAFASRKIREDETRRSTHLLRAGVGLLIFLVLLAFVRTSSQSDAPGEVLLSTVVWVNVAVVMLLGLTVFPSILSDERDAGTLLLLKLCSDRDASVLAGLVLPRLCYALVLLMVQVPFALLAVTLGGVTSAQVLGCYFALFCSSVLLCAVVTAAATLTRTAGAAVQVTVAYFVSLWIVVAGLEMAFGRTLGGPGSLFGQILMAMLAGFPGIEVSQWLDDPGRRFIGPYFWSVVIQTCLAAFVAWIVFPTADVTDSGDNKPSLSTRVRQYAARGRNFVPRDFERGPHAWKDYHLVAGGHVGQAFRVVAYLVIPFIVAVYTLLNWSAANRTTFSLQMLTMPTGEFAAALGYVVTIALPFECAWLASKRVRLELDDNCWELLELLPTSRQVVLAGKGTGTLRGLLPGALLGVFSLVVGGLAAGVEAMIVGVFLGGFFGGVMLGAMLVAVWFTASHIALRHKAGVATGITVLVLVFGVPFLFVIPIVILGGFGVLFSMLLIPVGLGFLVYAITSFSRKFYERGLQGSD